MEEQTKKKSAFGKIIAIVAVVIAILVVLVIIGSIGLFNAATAPQKAARAFMETAVTDSAAAYASSSSAFQETTSQEDLEVFLQQFPIEPDTIRFTSFQIDNNVAVVSGTTMVGGEQSPLTVTLVQETGEWRVVNFSFEEEDVPVFDSDF